MQLVVKTQLLGNTSLSKRSWRVELKRDVRIDVVDLAGRNQTIVPHLSIDKEYKFFIKACNDRFYYVSIRRQCSQWTRPEEDPYFLLRVLLNTFKSLRLIICVPSSMKK